MRTKFVVPEDLGEVAPAFAKYTKGPLLGELWQRSDLSPRDRSIMRSDQSSNYRFGTSVFEKC